jgi:uncharacterized protein RhaS with RHS repeats
MRRMLFAVTMVLSAVPSWAQAPAGAIEYYHTDVLGSVRAVSNEQGQVVRRHDYFAFGEEYLLQSGKDQLRFTGKERDVETSLDYFSARYYASRLGGSPLSILTTWAATSSIRKAGMRMRTRAATPCALSIQLARTTA